MKPLSFLKESITKYRLAYLYKHQNLLIDIEFVNSTNEKKRVWVEPSCVEFEIDANTEYKILTHDKFFRIDFRSQDLIIFYLQYTFGLKLYKREISTEIRNPNKWILDQDYSDIY